MLAELHMLNAMKGSQLAKDVLGGVVFVVTVITPRQNMHRIKACVPLRRRSGIRSLQAYYIEI